jgi:hypothetical protein
MANTDYFNPTKTLFVINVSYYLIIRQRCSSKRGLAVLTLLTTDALHNRSAMALARGLEKDHDIISVHVHIMCTHSPTPFTTSSNLYTHVLKFSLTL